MRMLVKLDGPCSECSAKCCKNYTVALTAYDLARLADQIGNFDWLTAVPAKEVRGSVIERFFLFKNGLLEEYLLCLKRDKKENCSLLGECDQCTAYNARPMICRIYPFQEEEDKVVYRKNYRCPRKWREDEINKVEFYSNVERQLEEVNDHGKWCREWNANFSRTGNFNSFVEFMYTKASQKMRKE